MSEEKNQATRKAKRSNAATALLLSGLVCGMVGLSFAAVPLYQIFCQVTGLGGTTQVAETLPEKALERVIKVRFNADIESDLPWSIHPLLLLRRADAGARRAGGHGGELLRRPGNRRRPQP